MYFKPEEKINCFDKIEKEYFNKNFGSMSKSDLETLLFSEYIEHHINHELPFDDYTLSKELGITQNRIRSLKERKELKYPHNGDYWQAEFAESVKNAKYDENDHYIKMIIEDVNVMNEVRHYIEQKGWYDECSLNKKLLRIPMDCFTEICVKDTNFDTVLSENTKKFIKNKVPKGDNSISEFLKDFSKDGFKKFLMSASKEVISLVIPLLPFEGVAKTALGFFANIITNS